MVSAQRVAPFPQRWNVAPQSLVPVLHETPEGERIAEVMRWGLVPHWAKDESMGRKLNYARVEGLADKPSFRQALRRRRCIVPASGFYEWQAADDAPWLLTCCIVTTASNALMAPLHDRMPLILPREHWGAWLNRSQQDPAALAPLMQGLPAGAMQAWPVTRAVNRGSAEGAGLIEPLPAQAA